VTTAPLASDAGAHGFELLGGQELPEYGSTAFHLRHLGTGCEVLHLSNEDPENLFAFAFPTPPEDDAGAAHVLEHAALCGSRRFPLKDPFLALLKSSLHTFLNAFTFPDKTVYPASTLLDRDFFNLLLVYGDAVFFPLLKEEVFMQEAHHLELSPEGPPGRRLARVGVVLNEMRGVFSSAESIVADASMRSLFPEGPYGFESGGHPDVIPTLTHERLAAFHARFYHPGNCRIFLYGNIPTARTLAFLDSSFLRHFEARPGVPDVREQPRWRQPRFLRRSYPVEKAQELESRCSATMNWLTVPVTDPLRLLGFEVLTELLLGNAGSPLHKSLLESRLGDDLSPATGLQAELKEAVLTVGLRGMKAKDVEVFESLVLRTLAELVEGGVPEEQVQAAVHRVEFRNREIRRVGGPYALVLLRRCLRGWLHGEAPERTLEFRPWLEALKERIRGGGYFERLIAEQLLHNPHRSTVLVEPDPDLGRREEEQERQELAHLEGELGAEGLEKLRREGERLQQFQLQPDSAEAQSTLPSLELSDVKQEVQTVPSESISWRAPAPLLFHDLFTNGIAYVDLAFDTRVLPEGFAPLLPLFSRAVCGSGLPGVPYYTVAGQLSLLTGGFGAFLSADTPVSPEGGLQQHLVFRTRVLAEKCEAALELVRRLLLEADFGDRERMKTLALEMRNDLKGSLVPSGSHFVSLRAGSRLSGALALEERWKGVSQLLWLARLCDGLEDRLSELATALEQVRERILSQEGVVVNLACSREALPRVIPALQGLLEALPRTARAGPSGPPPEWLQPGAAPGGAGASSADVLLGTMNVSFVARVIPASRYGTRENAQESVLAHFLSTGYLWEQVRMKGGAYGSGASSGGLEGLFTFSSYRDPNLLQTLEAFRGGLEFAREARLSEGELEKVIIGAAGREERPMAPREKSFVALQWELLGITEQMRRRRRREIVEVRREDMAEAAGRLLSRFEGGFTAVLTHRQALEAAGRRAPELAEAAVQLPD
jgi:Zn-dependent M16 (insulinase) family peptidase